MAQLSEQEIQEAAVGYFPLAVWLAKSFWKRLPPGREELDDLVGDAALGLVSCLPRYDSSRGTSLSSWISLNVRWALYSALQSGNFLHLPQEKRELIRLVQETEEYLEQWLQRKPTRAEIAVFLKYPEEKVERIMQMGELGIDLEPEEDIALSERRPEMGKGSGRPEKATALKDCFAAFIVEEKVTVRMTAHGAILEDIASVLRISVATAGRLRSEARQQLEESTQ